MKTTTLMMVLLAGLLAVSACKKKPTDGQVLPTPPVLEKGPGGTKPEAVEKKAAPRLEPVAVTCDVNRKVDGRDQKAVGAAIYLAYRSALKGDNPTAFHQFKSAYRSGVDLQQVKTYVWPALVRHVAKYTQGPNDATFEICRIDKQAEDRLKVFVKSRDPKKSHPPVVLVKEDDVWKIDVLTP